jgi:hypothetical protein
MNKDTIETIAFYLLVAFFLWLCAGHPGLG